MFLFLNLLNFICFSFARDFKLNIQLTNTIRIDKRFLGFTIDSEILPMIDRHFIFESEQFINLLRALGPSYLRMGGTAADMVVFSDEYIEDFEICNSVLKCVIPNIKLYDNEKYIKLNKKLWDKINDFIMYIGKEWEFIFGLNAMIRKKNFDWDPTNAIKLLKYSNKKKYFFHLELGNEPGEYYDVFKQWVTPEQLARDFFNLRIIMNNMSNTFSKEKLLIGPDLDKINDSADNLGYLTKFIQELSKNSTKSKILDRVSWHHYYIKGPGAKLDEFYNPSKLDTLIPKIDAVNKAITTGPLSEIPVWLGEGSNSWSSGTPNISDRYVAGFMFLDKIGQCTRNGVQVFIRQSLYVGNYALIGLDLIPNPDYWTAVLFKRLTSDKVIKLNYDPVADLKDGRNLYNNNKSLSPVFVRIYAHCSNEYEGGIAFYVLNLKNQSIRIIFENFYIINDSERGQQQSSEELRHDLGDELQQYLLTPKSVMDEDFMVPTDLSSRNIYLNSKHLKSHSDGTIPKLRPHIVKRGGDNTVIKRFKDVRNIDIVMPALTYGFYVYPYANLTLCYSL